MSGVTEGLLSLHTRMSSDNQNLQLARQCLDRARMEETPNGDPLVAARNYLTAMEYIQSSAAAMASSLRYQKDVDYFLYEVKGKLAVYEERVRLLLGAAREMGLEDKVENSAGMAGLFGGANQVADLDALLRNITIPTNEPLTTKRTENKTLEEW